MCLSGQCALPQAASGMGTLLQQPLLCGLSARARSRVALREILVQFPELFFIFGMPDLRHPLLSSSPRSLLYE